MKLTAKDRAIAAAYAKAEPKQFGTLHERMKYVMQTAKAVGGEAVIHDLWHALWDLQTEVSFHPPTTPPFGRRTVKPG